MKRTILKIIIAVLIFIFAFLLAIVISTHRTTDSITVEKETSAQASKESASTSDSKKKDNDKNKNKENKKENSTKEQSTATPTNSTEVETVEPTTELIQEVATLLEETPIETPTVSQDETDRNAPFIEKLGKEYCSIDELNRLNCNQLIIVQSFDNNAQISTFEKDANGVWSLVPELETIGFVGKLGVSNQSYEGSYQTPAGLFKVEDMFYIDDKPATGLSNSFQVTENTYWVDDPNSQFYNQRVEGTENMDWNSAERMIDYYASYKYGFVIDFNTNPIVTGKGSAIFFHIGYEPTAGCVAVSEDMMLSYLTRLDSAKNPYILIQ